MKNSILLLTALFSIFISCSDDDPISNPEPLGAYQQGLLISNEGPFASGHGSVTFISRDYNRVEQAIYQSNNANDNVGNVLNSIGFYEDKAYLVANVSNKITVVDRYTFERKSLFLSGLNNPRYFEAVNGIGFVTNWGDPFDETDDYVAVIDLSSESVIAKVPVDFGPEKIIALGSKIYIAHKGGYGHNNKVTVIDTNNYVVETEIEVGDVPGSMVADFKGNLWVLCEGVPAWTGNETNGSLLRINSSSNEITLKLDFKTQEHPQFLTGELGEFFYYLNGNIYKMRESDSALPIDEELSGLYFYTMEVIDGTLYGADAKDYASNGSIEVYNLAEKSFVTSIPAGIIPGGIYFNE